MAMMMVHRCRGLYLSSLFVHSGLTTEWNLTKIHVMRVHDDDDEVVVNNNNHISCQLLQQHLFCTTGH
jgi:hypothetical protein